MESAASELFALLVIVYLVDCFRWVARGAVLVRELPLLGAWLAEPLHLAKQFRRVLAFGWPVPPAGSLWAVEPLPARPGPEGLRFAATDARHVTTASAQERHVPWDQVSRLRVEGLELFDGKDAVWAFGSRRAAAAFRELAQRLGGESPKKRLRALEQVLRARHDVAAVRARLAPWRRWRWPVRLFDTALFVAIFGGWGALSFLERPPPAWLLLFAALLAWLGAAVVTVLAIKRVVPVALRPSGLQWFITLASPISLMRSADLVEAELMGDFEPGAVAVALLRPAAARVALEQWRRELLHPMTPEGLAPAAEAVLADDAWLRARLGDELGRLSSALEGTKAPQAPSALHCPRCLTEYTGEVKQCSSCPGVALTRGAR